MLDDIPLFQKRALAQIGKRVDALWPEARLGKGALIERAVARRVVERAAKLFKLVLADLLNGPLFAVQGQPLELRIVLPPTPAGKLP